VSIQVAMSALPPKAGKCSATRYVRFVPIADIANLTQLHRQLAPRLTEGFQGREPVRSCR
jgi:hypothetical protein